MNTMDPIERSHELLHQSQRILIIDDNPRIHEDFRKVLCPPPAPKDLAEDEAAIYGHEAVAEEVSPFEIDSAYQGREGLDMVEKALAEQRPYSMAFVDVRMPPGWDGVQTIRNIWKIYPELQVVICTAYSDHSFQEIIHTLGKSDNLLILKKPFDNVEVQQLAQALTKKWVVTSQARFRREQLEAAVEQRTLELARANKQLQAELKKRCEQEKELRETAESLRSSEEHLRLAGQVLGTGTYEYDLVNYKRFVSPTLQAMYDLDENEPTPFKAFSERMMVEDRAGFLAAVAASRRPESDGRFEHMHRVKQADGSERWLRSQAQTWFEGEGTDRHPVMVVGVVTDITERKRAEETAQRLSNIVASSNDAIIGETPEGIVTSWNRAAELLFGYSAAEMVGRTSAVLLPPNHASEERAVLDGLAGEDTNCHLETRRVRKDGTEVDVVITLSPIKDGEGRRIGVSKIARKSADTGLA